jgi:hypothetical protein
MTALITALFGSLEAGLSIWQSKDARKYLDRVIKLREDWYEEYNKERPDHAVLDNLELELLIICKSFNSQARISNTAVQ